MKGMAILANEETILNNARNLYKLEKILETLNIKLVNLEDSKFDIGMPVKAINIEEFKGCEELVITKMLEPVVMCDDLLERTGTVLIGLN